MEIWGPVLLQANEEKARCKNKCTQVSFRQKKPLTDDK